MSLRKYWPLFLFLGVFALGLCVFSSVLSADTLLQAPDAPVDWTQPGFKRRLAKWMLNGSSVLDHDAILQILVPSMLWNKLTYLLSSSLAAVAVGCYLRVVGLSVAASCCGGVFFAFSGYLFTLFNAGHVGVFEMQPYAVFMFACLERILRKPHLEAFILLAVCVACGLSAQPDGMVLALGLAAAYTLVRFFILVRDGKKPYLRQRWVRWLLGALAGGICFGFFSRGTIEHLLTDVLPGRMEQISKGEAVVSADRQAEGENEKDSEAEQKRAKWIFATNWSLPPEACLEFVAPGLRGLDSGNPNGPYWGRLGRSEGWEKTKRGFGNFRQHSLYLGAVPCALALYALVSALVPTIGKKRYPVSAAETDANRLILFWGCSAVLCVLFAMGRYTPVYRLLYSLPLFDMIRAPVKFLHLTEFSVSVLSAFGVSRLLQYSKGGSDVEPLRKTVAKGTVFSLCAIVLVLVVAALQFNVAAHQEEWKGLGLLTGSAETDRAISLAFKNRFSDAIFRGAWLLAATAVGIGLCSFPVGARLPSTRLARIVCLLLAVVGCADLCENASRYVRGYDLRAAFSNNPAVEDFRKHQEGKTDGLAYSYFPATGSILPPPEYTPFSAFPVNGIACADPWTTEKPESYTWKLFSVDLDGMTRAWAFWGVQGVFSQMETARMLLKTGKVEAIGLYDLAPPLSNRSGKIDSGPARVVPAKDLKRAQLALLRPKNIPPSIGVYYSAKRIGSDPEAVAKAFREKDFDPWRMVLVEAEIPEAMRNPVSKEMQPAKWIETPAEGGGVRAIAEVDAAAPGYFVFRENSLRHLKKLDATVNGERVEPVRANGLYTAVPVPQGKVRVVLQAHWRFGAFCLSLCGVMLTISALVFWCRRKDLPEVGK